MKSKNSIHRTLALTAMFVFTVMLLSKVGARAASPYYISFATGSNSNAGTKASPWKTAPYMPSGSSCTTSGSAPTYSHVAGDHFYFKGGDDWPNACFPLIPLAGGASGNPDYYGNLDFTFYSGTNSGFVNTIGTKVTRVTGAPFQDSNTSWVGGSITINGSSFTIASVQSSQALTLMTSAGTQSNVAYSNSLFVRPIFDSGGIAVSGNNIEFDMGANAIAWVTIDNIEWKGHFWNGVTSFGTNVSINGNTGGAAGQVVENNWAHGWTHAPYSGPNPNTQDGWSWLFGSNTVVCTTCIAKDNTIDGNSVDGADPQSGSGITNWYQMSFNFVCNMTDNLVGSGHQVDHNIVCNTNDSFDQISGNSGGQHGDSIFVVNYPTDPIQYIFDNLVYGASQGTEGPLFLEVGAQHTSGTAATAYVYNNIIYYGDWPSSISIDNRCFGAGCNVALWAYHIWNNTVVMNATACPPNVFCTGPSVPGADVTSNPGILVGAGNSATIGTVDLENNHMGSNYTSSSGTTSCMAGASTGRVFSCGSGITVTNPTDTGNIVTTIAGLASAGYTVANNFSETSAGNPTIGTGVNLTSLAIGVLSPLTTAINPLIPQIAGNVRASSGLWDSSADSFATSSNTGTKINGGVKLNGNVLVQ